MFAATATGCVPVDISGSHLAQGKLTVFLAIDRVSKFTHVECRDDVKG